MENIYPLKMALGERDEGAIESRIKSSYRLDDVQAAPTTAELIPMRALDTVVKENSIDHVDFIKMDVDGYETKVIRGAMHTLEQHRPIMFFEVTPSILKAEGNDFMDLLNLTAS
jgi:FkbM family methyltransferase